MRQSNIDLLDFDHFVCDLVFHPDRIAFGIEIGTNSYKGGKRDNLYLDIFFLCFTFGLEIKNLR